MDQDRQKDDTDRSPRPPSSKIRHGVSWGLGINWEAELGPFYQNASHLLGITTRPVRHIEDECLEQTDKRSSAGPRAA
jgi:hypothetical protein